MSLAWRTVLLCLSFFVVTNTAFAKRTPETTHAKLDAPVRGKASGMLSFPPNKNVQTTTTVVYLHGIHGLAKNGCPWLREGANQVGWLVCPEANVRLPNETFSWGGSASEKRAIVAEAERAVPGNGPSVLVGFSQGAYVAEELLQTKQGSYRGIVFLAATVEPRASDLGKAGVKRVVLGAGELDGSYAPMKATAQRLEREGVEVRFVSLGKVGHTYIAENGAPLAAAIAWAGGS
jgi:hypothetical protein